MLFGFTCGVCNECVRTKVMSTMDSPEKVCKKHSNAKNVTANVPNVICDVTDPPSAVVPHEDIDFNKEIMVNDIIDNHHHHHRF